MKKTLKKVILSFSFILFFLLYGQNIYAADYILETKVNGICLTEYETGWVVEDYIGDATNVIVPEEVDGRKVIAVGQHAFQDNSLIESVILPDTVTIIGSEAFHNCSNLREVYLGSMQGGFQFGGYSWMLHNCLKLEKISMSDEADFAIASDTATVGKNWGIFYKEVRDNLRSVYIGSSMSNVTKDLFYGKSLEWIEVGKNNPLYSSYNGVLYSADGKDLLVCGTSYQNETYVIPEGVEKILSPAFESCRNIKYITVPETVQSIGGAFKDTDLTLIVKRNSYADIFAQENGMKIKYEGEASPEYEAHIWKEDYTVDQVATCTKEGVKSIHCKICDKVKEGSERSIPVLPHQYGEKVTVEKSSMSENGTKAETCTVCGNVNKTPILALASVTLSRTEYVYDGRKKEPGITVTDTSGNILPASCYVVTYLTDGKSTGKHVIRITFTGDYEGEVDRAFTVKGTTLKKSSIIKLKAGKKRLTIKWKKITGITGYQIKCSTNRRFKKDVRTITVSKKKATQKVIKRLKSGKKYFVKIRTYKKEKRTGQKIFSSWSTVKKVKVR